MNLAKKQNISMVNLSNCIKILAADAVENAKSGHPGMPLGMSDLMTVLAFNFLKFNPKDPKWFNRDRLVLSAGHGSMLLYAFYYLAGYKDFSLDDIKNFRSFGSKTPGHPEREMFEAIETTTGPLGQGLATAVGMAIAEKKYKAEVGTDICNYKVYAIVGDGCLMEGISYEASSVAGHLKLNNLIIIFDDNGISIDGKTNLTVSEDHLAKFKALGFEVEAIDGHNHNQISQALSRAQNSLKPYFIACKTTIAQGANKKAGSEKSHGSPLGVEEIHYLKENIGFAQEKFFIPEELKKLWENAWIRNQIEYDAWQQNFNKLNSKHQNYTRHSNIFLPQNFTNLNILLSKLGYDEKMLGTHGAQDRSVFDIDEDRKQPGATTHLPSEVEFRKKSNEAEATRISSGKILELLIKNNKKIIAGSADLSYSNNLKNESCAVITSEDFRGNFIHYGVRENAMGAIMNGLALSGFSPIGGTFFVFSDYMRPSIRLAAIMGLPVIYVMTHDSIGVGEDGPTHQPVEHLASFRAMPNLQVFRPADLSETIECYELALNNQTGPSMIVLTRQAVPQIKEYNVGDNRSKNGAYLVSKTNKDNPDLVIFSSGSEVSLALQVKTILEQSKQMNIRVISVPCFELLKNQDSNYLPNLVGKPLLRVAIEAACSFGWHQLIGDNGLFFGVETFGASAPAPDLFKYFGLEAKNIADMISFRIQSYQVPD